MANTNDATKYSRKIMRKVSIVMAALLYIVWALKARKNVLINSPHLAFFRKQGRDWFSPRLRGENLLSQKRFRLHYMRAIQTSFFFPPKYEAFGGKLRAEQGAGGYELRLPGEM